MKSGKRFSVVLAAVCLVAALAVALSLTGLAPLRTRYLLLAGALAAGAALALAIRHLRWWTLPLAALAVVAVLAVNPVRVNLPRFEREAGRLEARARETAKRAPAYDEAAALAALPPNPYAGDTVLLSAREPEVRVSPGAGPDTAPAATFTEHELERMDHGGTVHWRTPPSLDVPAASLDRIVVTLETAAEAVARVAWTDDVDAAPGAVETDLDLRVAPGEPRTYAIRTGQYFLVGERLRRVIVSAPLDAGLRVSSVRVETTASRYADAPSGLTSVERAGQRRDSVYCRAPGALSWTVRVPEHARLRFGAAAISDGTPLRLRAMVREDATAAPVWESDLAPGEAWVDVDLDLGRFAGREVRVELEASGGTGVALWSNPTVYGPPPERRNVLIVVADAMRADHLGCYGYGRDTSPAIDRLAAGGVLLERAVSQGTKTWASCPSYLTSLYPSATGVWHLRDRLGAKYTTLAEVCRAQGFATLSHVQNSNAGYNKGLQQGFETLEENWRSDARPEEALNAELVARLAAERRNWLAYIHVLDPHGPYDPAGEARAWANDQARGTPGAPVERSYLDPEWVETPGKVERIARYDAEIRHFDRVLARFLRELDAAGVLEHTLVLLISDHGEYLGEAGYWEHHPPTLQPAVHVPVIAYGPRWFAPRRVAAPVQLLDLMPTVLAFLGVPAEGLLMQGDSLLPLFDGADAARFRQRWCLADEVELATKGEVPGWGSVFFGPWHALHTHAVDVSEVFGDRRGWPGSDLLLRTRFYRFDRPAATDDYLNTLYFDPYLKHRVRTTIQATQAANLETWRALRETAEQAPRRIDPEEEEQLRAIGYL